MKTLIPILIAATTLLAVTTAGGAEPNLSPRAKANQIRVVGGQKDIDFARVQLGESAKAKASGDFAVTLAKSATSDRNLSVGRVALGVAAKEKAMGHSMSSMRFEVAPLK